MVGTEDEATRDEGAAKVDEFLSRLPEDQRKALGGLRGQIRSAAPAATEAISYGVPAFKISGRPLVSYGAGKAHCAFYVMSTAVIEAHSSELKGYDLGKGSIRFEPHAPLPEGLVRALVDARMAEHEERGS